MDFQAFSDNLHVQYENFRKAEEKVRVEGTTAHNLAGKGVYFIAFRFSDSVTEPVSKFNERIASIVPVMKYDISNLHTTLSDYALGPKYTPDKSILSELACGVRDSLPALKGVGIYYRDWLFNQNTVIMSGMPNEAFLSASESVVNNLASRNLSLRMPWGAHMTTARFSEARKPQELSDFLALMKEAPIIGKVKPTALDVGFADIGSDYINLATFARFNLNA